MSQLKSDVRFPYCDIHSLYLKCGRDQRVKKTFLEMIQLIYTECIDVVWPIVDDEPTNRYFTYGINVLHARTYYDNFGSGEIYPWHVNPIAVQVPYGNIREWYLHSTDWRVCLSRTMRSIWHGIRLIPNHDPMTRTYINVGIPWILLDNTPADLTDQELVDYAEIILGSIGPQIWVRDKRVISPAAHRCV